MDNILNYYVLEKNKESKDFYFENEGIFNFWNKYLIIHIGKDNIVLANRTNKIFNGKLLSKYEKVMLYTIIKENFCSLRKCKTDSVSSLCSLAEEWGKVICNIDMQRKKEKSFEK